MMAPRRSDPQPSRDLTLPLRGVFEADYLVRGKRYLYSINSHGELHGERLVARSASRSKMDDATESLWLELDREDHIMPHDRPPVLRLEPRDGS
jgi:hypothetical protein